MAMTTGPVRLPPSFDREVPGADRRATEAILNLFKVSNLLQDALSAHLRPAGLTPAAFNTLMILQGADEPLCPSQIGERLLVTRGTVTGVLDSLEKRGLIKRSPDRVDRRMLRIELTAKARTALAKIVPGLHRHEAELLGHLSRADKDALVRLLTAALCGLEGTA